METRHYKQDRKYRTDFIKNNIGYGNPVFAQVVDRGHKDGPERHVITDTAILMVFNAITHRHITDLVLRPGQITKYNWNCPKSIMDLAREHQRLGYNKI